MSGNVGPVLERVTSAHLLGRDAARSARESLVSSYSSIESALQEGDFVVLGQLTSGLFDGPLRQIIPEVDNAFTAACIAEARKAYGEGFLGFVCLVV